MAPSDLDRERLASAARARRKNLGLGLTDVTAKAGGTSKKTWTRVEKGMPVRDISYVAIDGLLRWAPGSCLAILDGGDPVPVDPSQAERGTVLSELSPAMHDAEARKVIQLAIVATTDGLPSDQIRALSERAVSDLRAAGLL